MVITSVPDNTKKLQKPCNECPFSKTIEPGFTGGSDPSVYIGQGHGSFWLPCHKDCDFDDPDWKKDTSVQQCAGAAIYRANIERDHLMPKMLHRLPKSDLAFESPEELYAHHKGISLQEATEFLKNNPPRHLMAAEFCKIERFGFGK